MISSNSSTHDEVTSDAFLGGAVQLCQPRHGYRAGLDAVLLAAAAQSVCNEHARLCDRNGKTRADQQLNVLDVGAGVGTVGLCLARQRETTSVVLYERDPELVQLARQNIDRNNLNNCVRGVVGQVGCSDIELNELGLAPNSFDVVLANPPFHHAEKGTTPQSDKKAAAHQMQDFGLDHWCRFLVRMAKAEGWLVIVHKMEALDELLLSLKTRAGGLHILPIYPRSGSSAHRVIVAGRKGCRSNLKMLPGLVLHEEGNGFTPATEAILRHGAALDIDFHQ